MTGNVSGLWTCLYLSVVVSCLFITKNYGKVVKMSSVCSWRFHSSVVIYIFSHYQCPVMGSDYQGNPCLLRTHA